MCDSRHMSYVIRTCDIVFIRFDDVTDFVAHCAQVSQFGGYLEFIFNVFHWMPEI